MATLRNFVAGALGVSKLTPEHHVYSKPDRISDTLELRRLHVQPGTYSSSCIINTDCETDFYEMYWQHLMQGTGWGHIFRWATSLLRHPGRLNWRIQWRLALVMVSIAVTVAGLVAVASVTWPSSLSREWTWLAGIGLVLLAFVVIDRWDLFFLGTVGDAARYLDAAPPNIEVRRRIRAAGLTLLRGLHEDELRRYERIILVGHSLGSVIAYDLITWLWQELHYRVEPDRNDRKSVPTKAKNEPPPDSERSADLDASPLGVSASEYQKKQRVLWEAERRLGLPWRITDLITLGSPLSHADALLADGRDALMLGIAQREFPSCPPMPEDPRDKGLLSTEYVVGGVTMFRRILHHAAPFAVTRWTNLFFPGDVVGGPITLFGEGLRNEEIVPEGNEGRAARTLRSHTLYWSAGQPTACKKLRRALDLNDDEWRR